MIDLVLDNLGLETLQGFGMLFHLQVLPGKADGFIAFCFPDTFQGKAAFLRLILPYCRYA